MVFSKTHNDQCYEIANKYLQENNLLDSVVTSDRCNIVIKQWPFIDSTQVASWFTFKSIDTSLFADPYLNNITQLNVLLAQRKQRRTNIISLNTPISIDTSSSSPAIDVAYDFARYEISKGNHAIGIRLRKSHMTLEGDFECEKLILLKIKGSQLLPILDTSMEYLFNFSPSRPLLDSNDNPISIDDVHYKSLLLIDKTNDNDYKLIKKTRLFPDKKLISIIDFHVDDDETYKHKNTKMFNKVLESNSTATGSPNSNDYCNF